VAWTYLYGTMGYASHLIAESLRTTRFIETADLANSALTLYFGQLALNFIWTPIFFGLKKPAPALVDILTLTGTVFYMTVSALLHLHRKWGLISLIFGFFFFRSPVEPH
jgi:benzodiazapine receptor